MARHVGYQTRGFVTFGPAISLRPNTIPSRAAIWCRWRIGSSTKSASSQSAPTAHSSRRPCGRRSTRSELASRIDDLLAGLSASGANLGVRSGRQAVEDGADRLVERNVLVAERQRLRVRDRLVLRYYAKTIAHLLAPNRRAVH